MTLFGWEGNIGPGVFIHMSTPLPRKKMGGGHKDMGGEKRKEDGRTGKRNERKGRRGEMMSGKRTEGKRGEGFFRERDKFGRTIWLHASIT